jgi:hypothetical protein
MEIHGNSWKFHGNSISAISCIWMISFDFL